MSLQQVLYYTGTALPVPKKTSASTSMVLTIIMMSLFVVDDNDNDADTESHGNQFIEDSSLVGVDYIGVDDNEYIIFNKPHGMAIRFG